MDLVLLGCEFLIIGSVSNVTGTEHIVHIIKHRKGKTKREKKMKMRMFISELIFLSLHLMTYCRFIYNLIRMLWLLL